MKFRKKPIVIEAMQWNGTQESYETLVRTLKIPAKNICMYCGNDLFIEIQTLEGNLKAYPCDWIVKGIKGEFYPVKFDIFELIYEEF